jgi:hypothetical protein
VLRRPENVRSVLASLSASERELSLHPLFLVSANDLGEIGALKVNKARYLTAEWDPGPGDYARKMNMGYRMGVAHGYDWVLLAADDVAFHPGWAEAATQKGESSGACVVGTNDLGNPEVIAGRHATHPLVHKDYLECGTVDEEGKILHEGYAHNWVDSEFVGTAKARGTFVAAPESQVEHLHWAWGKGENDEVYEIAQNNYHADRLLYEQRKPLWEGA